MTKLVTFTRAMAPHVAGESRLVPDEVADRLVAQGDASAYAWPPQTAGVPTPPAAPASRLAVPAALFKTKRARS